MQFVEQNVTTIQRVLMVLVLIMLVAIFSLSLSLSITTVVTDEDLLLGKVIPEEDRAKIQWIVGLSFFSICAVALSTYLQFRYGKQ